MTNFSDKYLIMLVLPMILRRFRRTSAVITGVASSLYVHNGNQYSVRCFCARASASPVGALELPTVVDSFRGVNVDLGAVPTADCGLAALLEDGSAFRNALHANMEAWKRARYRAVWLKIPTEHAALIAEAVREGFVFHHAEMTHAVMVTWLPRLDMESTAAAWDKAGAATGTGTAAAEERARLVRRAIEYVESTPLPANASHQVGVGCVVVHPPRPTAGGASERPRILAVQERRGPLRGKGVWKLPTGLVGQGEDLAEGAVREVLEETGVRAAFRGVVAIRHAHGALHDKSDLFYVCLLEALPAGAAAQTGDVPLELQREELEACAWLDLEEYLGQERYRNSPLYTRINEAIAAAVAGAGLGLGVTEAPMFVHSKLAYGYTYYKGSECSLYHSNHLKPATADKHNS